MCLIEFYIYMKTQSIRHEHALKIIYDYVDYNIR